MKIKIALSLLLAAALLPSCTTTTTTSNSSDDKGARYATAEGLEADIPAEGPTDPAVNPAYIPTPLLRSSAASGP